MVSLKRRLKKSKVSSRKSKKMDNVKHISHGGNTENDSDIVHNSLKVHQLPNTILHGRVMCMSKDAKYIGVYSQKNGHQLIVWKMDDNDYTKLHELNVRPISELLFFKEKYILFGTDNIFSILDVESGSVLRTLEGNIDNKSHIHISDDNKRVVSINYNGTISIWNIEDI
jgi:WD40 repeat protein